MISDPRHCWIYFLTPLQSTRHGAGLGPLASAMRIAVCADMVIGSRLAGARTPGALPWHAVLGNRLAAGLIAFFSGVHLTDLGPFRAVRYDALIALGLQESTYGWLVEMIVKGARRGLRIVLLALAIGKNLSLPKWGSLSR
jgi:hypothetical protein